VERRHEYRPVLFFLATYVVTWIPWFAGIYLATRPGGQRYASLFGYIGLLGPLAVTIVLILTSGSRALKADFRSRFSPRRLRPPYVILAITMPAVLMYLSIWLSLAFRQSADQFRFSRDGNMLGMIILAMIVAPIVEEISWRGYGVDSLRAKRGTLASTLLFGGLWSLWHAPLVLLPGTYQHEVAGMDNSLFLVNFFLSAIPAAIIANWLYYSNHRSILVGILFHSMANAAAEVPSAGQVTKSIATVLWGVVALAIIAFDRTTFAGGPRDFVADLSHSSTET
jgi:hypothetical protein